MKVLIVSQSEGIKNLLSYHLKPVGFDVVHYNDPVKAIDNLEELDPEMILYHTGDFPRHWKPLLKLLRQKKAKEETVFILLKGADFPFEEAAKASHLGINGIIDANLQEKQQVLQLEELFRRYRSIKDQRRFHRLVPNALDKLQLLFTHPYTLAIITGSLSEVSIKGASFKPSDPLATQDLKRGQEIPVCTLRVGEHIISILCQVTRNNGEMGLQFRSFETGGHHKLFQYIQTRADRELNLAIEKEKKES